MKITVFLFALYLLPGGDFITTTQIPEYLLECYKNGTFNFATPKSTQFFVELLVDIERYHANSNIRTVTTSLLHYLKLDGIERGPNVVESERVMPYRASAFQYTKFSFLMDLLIPSQNPLEIPKDVDQQVVCGVHLLVSSSVDPWERGDEHKICPLSMTKGSVSRNAYPLPTNRSTTRAARSRCPIEWGVVKTGWGDVSFGTLISGIAAGLERQDVAAIELFESMKRYNVEEAIDLIHELNVDFNIEQFESEIKTKLAASSEQPVVSNLMAATIAGDLAEVAIRQGPFARTNSSLYVFGPPGRWNDTLVPRNHYLIQAPPLQWEMTDAEILGGIDGVIIGESIKSWLSFRANTRLSQVIEMYYSNYGVPYGGENVRACDRRQNFLKIIRSTDLERQTVALVNVLWLRLSKIHMATAEIDAVAGAAYAAFEEYWPKLLETLPGCNINGDANQMDITLVTDQSWTKYQTIQLVSVLTETLDVSNYGSTMSLIHGTTGEWISPPSNSTMRMHENIKNSTNVWVRQLDLPNVLTTIVGRLENETRPADMVAFPKVVILAAPSSRWSQVELDRARTIMDTIRNNYIDVYFLYITADEHTVEQLGKGPYEYSDVHILSSSTNVQEIAEKIRSNFVERVIPMRIISPPCDKYNFMNGYEDYISVGQKIVYRVHPRLLKSIDSFKIFFQGANHGEISVCISRQYSEEGAASCKIISENNDAGFQLDKPCKDRDVCDPIYFIVRARSSNVNCADKNCRYPNHIRFIIRHHGLDCNQSGETSSSNVLYARYKNSLFVALTMLQLYLLNILVTE